MTDLRRILVHQDTGPRSATRLSIALELAQRHGAAVTALYAASPVVAAVPFPADFGQAATVLRDDDAALRAGARSAFDRAVAGSPAGAEWSEVIDFPTVGARGQREAGPGDSL
jgi:hypothetical protein